jgi:hypothetical protein
VGVLWIDAHSDLNTTETLGSGNLHGMPVGLLMDGMEIDHNKYPGLELLQGGPRLKPHSIVYVGLRDVDLSEAEAISSLGIVYHAANMGSEKPLTSVKALINDRSLEKAFVFDEPEDPLFDLAELKSSPSKMGKTAARAVARKEAAILNREQAGDGDLPSLQCIRPPWPGTFFKLRSRKFSIKVSRKFHLIEHICVGGVGNIHHLSSFREQLRFPPLSATFHLRATRIRRENGRMTQLKCAANIEVTESLLDTNENKSLLSPC